MKIFTLSQMINLIIKSLKKEFGCEERGEGREAVFTA